MEHDLLDRALDACRAIVVERFPGDHHAGAAAMVFDDGSIHTGISPVATNPAVQVCHEVEPYAAAHRLGRRIVASVCLHRKPGEEWVVLSPCGVCRERLADHGPDVLVAVADPQEPARARWRRLGDVLPDYWMTGFTEELETPWP